MKSGFNPSRRSFLKSSVALGSLLVAEILNPLSAFPACIRTPSETSGPFYPLTYPLDNDNDLTFFKNKSEKAQGDIIFIKGVVQDEKCRPIPGAQVEIWQACSTGKYNHPGDRNSAKLDPNFQYWGKAISNDKGEYGFKTIKPGSYPISWFWTRPPHIHFMVSSRNFHPFTTQMYFAGEPLNSKDRLLGDHPKEDQERCIIPFQETNSIRIGKLDLTLKL